jgi:spermidine/putrescine ABC transporter ATP-binding subunit
MVQPASVELTHVTKCFGSVTAVHDVNLTIAQGEFFALLGPSGCGKTTTLRLIGGLETPDTGTIRIGGEEVTARPPYERNANIVFQNYALFPHLTVQDNVAFGLRLRSRRLPEPDLTRRVEAALELVQLGGLGSRRPQQLSGGQQQRVALARALVLRPQVLLLDEPLGALDRKLRKAMQTELRRIQREVHITFLYVTHDQEEALGMADRMAVMRHGRLEQVGTPREVFQTPRTTFVADFMGAVNIFRGHVTSVMEQLVCITTTTGFSVVSQHCHELTVGATVSFAVRPEAVQVLPADADWPGANTCSGRITGKEYLGESTEVAVTLAGGEVIISRMQSRLEQKFNFRAHEVVRLGWHAEDCHLLCE